MTMAPDYLVEVRDRDFIRRGQIAHEYLDLMFTEVFRGIGSWQLKLPTEHPLLPILKEKGSGIVITETWDGGSRTYSGRMNSCKLDQDAEDPAGTWTISGYDDGILAKATTVYPDPTAAADAQTVAYWNRSSNGETVMKEAVRYNAGDLALAARKYPWLVVPTNLNRGASASANARFDVLGDLLQTIGAQSGLGWTFYQSGSQIVFDVTEPTDRTAFIRLDIATGGLESSELAFSAPAATEVLVLGQGEGAERTVLPVTSTAATAEATAWALRWETTKDQRNTDDPAELLDAGNEILNESGATIHSLKVTPSDAPGQRLGRDWGLGDTVTVVIDGQETQAVVTQIATAIGSEGVIKQATVGDPVGFDWEAKVSSKLSNQGKRIDRLENYIDTSVRLSGSTAERNAIFGTPATDAERVALANKRVTWFNLDLGWEESYYATTGLTGLAVKGLIAGYASGWYPTGNGLTPEISMEPTATSAGSTGNYLAGWNGTVRRRGGDAFFVYDQYGPTLKLPGYYDINVYSVQPAGTGLADYHIRLNNLAGTVVEWQHNLSGIVLSSSYFTSINADFRSLLIKPGGNLLRWFVSSGTLNMHNTSGPAGSGRGQLFARYVRPPLVSD